MRSVIYIAALICANLGAELPPDFQRCVKADPKFNECLRGAIDDAIKKLANGNELLRIPPVDPIYVPSATIKEGSGAVHVVQKFTDLLLHGISKSKVTLVTTRDLGDKFEIVAKATADLYTLKAKYDFNGHLLLLPVVGKGDSVINLYDVKSDWVFLGDIITKNDEKYLNMKTLKVSLFPGKVKYTFENLFNGNKALSDNIHQVLNENWKEVFEDVKEGYEELVATVCKTLANQIFNKIPLKKIFL